ncbi:uncharacterized protein F5891DRAFT_1036071 [Suillus fuscotomentosus]|uniref:BAG domain-containing protein n=1 Tax=Suillus fuscotomentosus TaxID=1912939 RepID=A0AAD4E7Y0_9AGAM|nr:uncharacterized protein F5891DRAFT_1036071 [Suillus fuscotomentosus]KAG1900094.1 hypothetical protein F5891DRAFT_1036071 [Suillus fuscotomentosus]
MSFTTYPCSHYRPLPFPLNDTQFPFDGDSAHKKVEIQQANRAIRNQAVCEHEWHDLAVFQAHLEEQRLLARRRRLDAENFFAGTTNPRCSHRFNNSASCDLLQPKVSGSDEPSLKDMISSHLEEQRRLLAEHRSEVRDVLQAILTHLSKGTTIKAPIERDPVSSSVNVNEKGPVLLQEGKGEAREISDSDTQEESAAWPAQVASSLSQISSLSTRLESLLAAFQFPAELDFSPALDTAGVFALTYTPANAPVRAQEHALSLLFADLDNIPSFGSGVVRNARRAVVTRVDQALKELDKGVEERKGRARAKKADPVTMPIKQPTRPNYADSSEPGNVTSANVALAQVSVVDEVPI